MTERISVDFKYRRSDAVRYFEKLKQTISEDVKISNNEKDGKISAINNALEGYLQLMPATDAFSSAYRTQADNIQRIIKYCSVQNPITIAVDFDNTLARTKDYPDIGEEIPLAFSFLRKWKDMGVNLILWTMRTGDALTAAIDFCWERGIEFWGVNENPSQGLYPHPASGKCYSDILIDDTAICCPLDQKGAVDWEIVGESVDAKINAMRKKD